MTVLKLGNKGSLCPDGTSQQIIGSMLKALSNSAAMELCACLQAQSITSNYTTTAASQLCDCCTNALEREMGGEKLYLSVSPSHCSCGPWWLFQAQLVSRCSQYHVSSAQCTRACTLGHLSSHDLQCYTQEVHAMNWSMSNCMRQL